MAKASIPNILVNNRTTITNNSNMSSTGTVGSSSSETTASSSALPKGKAKSINIPSISSRQSERVANSNQNRPNVNTTKQSANLPTLPEEDIALIIDFTNDTTLRWIAFCTIMRSVT
ncbi:hypothetical protein BDZ94DRAFT_1315906 [Collybia nuda]|uniref:Uncharacterized protein n=1 Tax=Collybia nuda TaxID=64659 RepID=A0A9P5XS35_9AGAR|nr:hypothetical protein BDZ94DRAFT_1315906 [Collybia nuda]